MSGLTVIWVFLLCTLASLASYFAIPKSSNQTVLRTCIILSIACCYLMWAITYMAQLNPIVNPIRSDLRGHHE
ncbi:ATPase, V0 complex, subunit E1/e2 [Umbelopsis sp. PMI_123]|nr:ATPase, V0 complex, subunit E1/e2 [Umbelopsis sp. PMI_123]